MGYSCPSPEATSEEPAEDRRACLTAPVLNSALSQNNSLWRRRPAELLRKGAGCTSSVPGGEDGGLGLSHIELPRKQACGKECAGL